MMRKVRQLTWLAPVVLNVAVLPVSAWAHGVPARTRRASVASLQPVAGAPIQFIKVDGNVRVDAATVLNYMTLHVGDRYDPATVDQSIKSLYATDLFSDVKIRREGHGLLVSVVENPIINRVVFEGNRAVSKDTLLKELQERPRATFTRAKVQADVQRMIAIYRRQGRFAATIDPKIVKLPENRVDLIFEIKEGAVTGISSINFVGNKRFSQSELRDVIATRESAWYRFWGSSDNYDPDRLNYDQELLRRFYLKTGYYDFRILSAVADLTPDKKSFVITFTIDEGPPYDFGSIKIDSKIPDLTSAALQNKILTTQGEYYDTDKVQKTVDALTEAAGNLGYAFVNIEPNQVKDAENHTVAVTYVINPAPRVYVEKINITGNVRTLDSVIRREFRLSEGDAFNTSKKRRTVQRLQALNYFSKVHLTQQPGSAPDRTIMNVHVQEKSTGSLQISAGYGTSEGVLGSINVTEHNFLGKGQIVSIGGTLSQKRTQAQFSFTEPYFLDRNLEAGFDLYAIRYDYQDYSQYNLSRLGTTLRLGFSLSEYLRMNLRYFIRNDNVYDVDRSASVAVKQAKGSHLTSGVGYDLTYDRRDNPNDPRRGYVLSFGQEVTGLGGDVSYLKTTAGAGYYIPINDDVVLRLSGEGGNIIGLGQKVLINNNFSVGGENLRGFKDQGIGPRDLRNHDALGGKNYAAGTVEMTFPIGLPNEYGVRAGAFSDFGTLWGNDYSAPGVTDDTSIRVSTGVALYWQSPFGPINISFAKPLVKKRYDQTQVFRFSFGTNF